MNIGRMVGLGAAAALAVSATGCSVLPASVGNQEAGVRVGPGGVQDGVVLDTGFHSSFIDDVAKFSKAQQEFKIACQGDNNLGVVTTKERAQICAEASVYWEVDSSREVLPKTVEYLGAQAGSTQENTAKLFQQMVSPSIDANWQATASEFKLSEFESGAGKEKIARQFEKDVNQSILEQIKEDPRARKLYCDPTGQTCNVPARVTTVNIRQVDPDDTIRNARQETFNAQQRIQTAEAQKGAALQQRQGVLNQAQAIRAADAEISKLSPSGFQQEINNRIQGIAEAGGERGNVTITNGAGTVAIPQQRVK